MTEVDCALSPGGKHPAHPDAQGLRASEQSDLLTAAMGHYSDTASCAALFRAGKQDAALCSTASAADGRGAIC